jgi:ABC-type antimicrobial peptide transport system permease subunit
LRDAFTAIATLAIGIGGNTAVFTVTDAMLRRGMLPLGIGLTIGMAAWFAVNRVLRAELVQVSPDDPITLTTVSAALIVTAILGCLIPARRATRVDPVAALRHDESQKGL